MSQSDTNPLENYQGTARHQRRLRSLMPGYVKVDERSVSDLLAFSATYSDFVKFYTTANLSEAKESVYDWSLFFKKDVSVFLAELLVADIDGPDEVIHSAFLRVHTLKAPEEQQENFVRLIDTLLDLTEMLMNWKISAHRSKQNRIEREIERALEGELGEQLLLFLNLVQNFLDSGEFAGELTWGERIEKLQGSKGKVLPAQPSNEPPTLSEKLADRIINATSKFQDFYQRLYLTLVYLKGISPELFQESITEKNDHEPDIGLFISFLKLFGHAQDELNQFTERHLDYYYENVLRQQKDRSVPDHSIVSFELSPHVRDHFLPAGTKVLAGVNDAGVPSHYETLTDLMVTKAVPVALKTLFVSKNPLVRIGSSYRLVTAIHAAPVADSLDGLGQPFEEPNQRWPILGEDQFDLGRKDRRMIDGKMGFAFAASALLLAEGEREINVTLKFTEESYGSMLILLEDMLANDEGQTALSNVFGKVLQHPFYLYLTTAEGWLAIKKYSLLPPEDGQWGASTLRLRFYLKQADQAITAFDPGIHLDTFTTQWPVLKVLLSADESIYPYSFLQDLELEEVIITTKVTGMRNLTAYNDQGLLDVSAPFPPFGTFPRKNSYLIFGNKELFNKSLNQLTIHLEWGDLPDEAGGLASHYEAYGTDVKNEDFKFELSALSDYGFSPKQSADRDTFNMFDTLQVLETPLQPTNTIELKQEQLKRLRINPTYSLNELEEFSNQTRTGFLKLGIAGPPMVFGHQMYPRIFARKLAEQARPRPFSIVSPPEEELVLPNEPYTPMMNRLTIDYTATSRINLRQLEKRENPETADYKMFRIHPFGTETVYSQKQQKQPYLLPRFVADAYLYIGLRDLNPPEHLSLFFDIQDSIKRLIRMPLELQWQYLHEGDWVNFETDYILGDGTYNFATSGIISFRCPAEMTKGNSLLHPDLHWIRVAAAGNMNIPGNCRIVSSQAVEVRWIDNHDPAHLNTKAELRPPIEALATPQSSITGLTQPTGFWGGKPAESQANFYVRTSERLRHKNRASNIWDIEHLVLQRFSDIHQAKCIGHFGNDNVLDIGGFLLVVIPIINPINLNPKVGYHRLQEIENFLETSASPFAAPRVINPVYERLKISCQIKLNKAFEQQAGHCYQLLQLAIRDFICPWLDQGALTLGGSISKNDILAVLSDHPCVEFITAFSMVHIYETQEDLYSLNDTASTTGNLELLTASKPWSLLVPADRHQITFLDDHAYAFATQTAIDDMRLETDFVVVEKETKNLPGKGSEANPDDAFELPLNWLLK